LRIKPKKDSKLYFGFSKSKMTPFAILSLIVIYFGLFSHFTSKKTVAMMLFKANKISKWYCAFGMIGTALSGVTFISVPGEVEPQVENNLNTFSLFLEMQ
jgi:hypothetical protein